MRVATPGKKCFADDYRRENKKFSRYNIEDYSHLLLEPCDDDVEDRKIIRNDDDGTKALLQYNADIEIDSLVELLINSLPLVLKPESPLIEFTTWLRVFMEEFPYENP